MSHWRITLASNEEFVVESRGTAIMRSVDVDSAVLTIVTTDMEGNLLESRAFAPGAWKEVRYVA